MSKQNRIADIIPRLQQFVLPLIGAMLVTGVSVSNMLLPVVNFINDALYQQPGIPDQRIVIIGVDSSALEEFGAWPWDRSLMAEAVSYLNADPDQKPAVIGIDVVYDAIDHEPSDALLVKALEKEDNVVISSYATFGSNIVDLPDGHFYVDTHAALELVQPYDELRAVTAQGHVNAMLDTDGILRHAIGEITTIDGQTIPAFNWVIASQFVETMGLNPLTPPITDAKNRWYVPQQSPPGGYSDGISVADLINQTVDPQFFADKIVLIGPYDTSFKDEYLTPIDRAHNMAGVEYQANVIGALLAGDIKWEVDWQASVLLFLISFMAFWGLPKCKLWMAAIVVVLLSSGWILTCTLLFSQGLVLPTLYLPLSLVMAFVFSIVHHYVTETAKRKQVANTFRRYVAPEIVNELLKGDPSTLHLGGHTAEVAVLFVDIRGFTALSTKLPPTTIVEILNRILQLTTDCILHNQGTLDKYIGDCTMAFWGAPLPQEDCVYKAVKTAVEMQKGMDLLSLAILEQYGHAVQFGIGVNYGMAIVGNIGATVRMDYTVIGDVVNTAARLESHAAAGEILVSKEVVQALSDRFPTTTLGTTIKLKGKADDFEIFRVDRPLS